MEATTIFFIVAGVLAVIAIGLLMKMRSMPKYKITTQKDSDGIEKYYVQIRKWFSYKYLEQTKDFPGYENDTFATSSYPVAGHETEDLAEMIVKNHMMTTVSGIE